MAQDLKIGATWPEVFLDKNYSYPKSMVGDDLLRRVISDGLIGWALCMLGNKPPESFGYGMVTIGGITKCKKGAIVSELEALAKEKGWLK